MSNKMVELYVFLCYKRVLEMMQLNDNDETDDNEADMVSNPNLSHLDINILPNDKIKALSKFTAFADNNIIMTQKLKLCWGKHAGKKRKCWSPAFSPFPTMFSKVFFSRGVKSRNCVVKG